MHTDAQAMPVSCSLCTKQNSPELQKMALQGDPRERDVPVEPSPGHWKGKEV